jgi:hypothetical protein
VNTVLTPQGTMLFVTAFISGCGGGCGGTVSSSSGRVPDSGADATLDSGSDVASDTRSENSEDSSTETCVVNTCDGRRVEVPYHYGPYDGGVYVGYDGGGAGYCPGYCGVTSPVCQAPDGCWCQCFYQAADPGCPKILRVSCTDCVCGDSGTWLANTTGRESCGG